MLQACGEETSTSLFFFSEARLHVQGSVCRSRDGGHQVYRRRAEVEAVLQLPEAQFPAHELDGVALILWRGAGGEGGQHANPNKE